MASHRTRRTNRTRPPPGTFIFNWQPADSEGTKPLVRRPATACEACRSAKVKCNGKQQCDRCRNRGLECTYDDTNMTTTSKNKAPPMTRRCRRVSAINGIPEGGSEKDDSHDSEIPKQPSFDFSSNGIISHSDSTTEVGPAGSGGVRDTDWHYDSFNSALEQFDWEFAQFDDLDMMPSMSFSPLTTQNALVSQATMAGMRAPEDSNKQSLTTESSSPGRHTDGPCRCRANLIDQIPRLDAAIQERPKPRLDRMFKATQEIVTSCHSAANCLNCRIGPTDLVHILTVFQQTAFCFDQIARFEVSDNIKIGFGDYQVQLDSDDDPGFKNALVLNLIKLASSFLDTVEAHQNRLSCPAASSPSTRIVISRSPICLNNLNFGYVQETIGRFRLLFRLMTGVINGEAPDNT